MIESDTVRDSTKVESPRARLLLHGSRTLSDTELLSVLLGAGSRSSSAMSAARELLRVSDGLGGLTGLSPEAFLGPGIGPATVAIVLAALEVGRRLARGEIPEREPLRAPAQVATYLRLRYGVSDQEVMGALYLDSRHRLIGEKELFRGTLSRASVEPRPILRHGLLQAAAGFVLFHTHPSGDPSPSAEDLAFTRRIASAGETVGVRLIDHLIVGRGSWVSLRERGAT